MDGVELGSAVTGKTEVAKTTCVGDGLGVAVGPMVGTVLGIGVRVANTRLRSDRGSTGNAIVGAWPDLLTTSSAMAAAPEKIARISAPLASVRKRRRSR
jgi:hypothetical protein